MPDFVDITRSCAAPQKFSHFTANESGRMHVGFGLYDPTKCTGSWMLLDSRPSMVFITGSNSFSPMAPQAVEQHPLSDLECRHYRDLLRAGRYAALADSEGFIQICFALEAIGLRLLRKQADLGSYKTELAKLAQKSSVLSELTKTHPSTFKAFDSLYEIVRKARNDNMHMGAYARHATTAAIELCIGLEESLMADVAGTVGGIMVKSPITVAPWQPVAQARQLMLMHSFSFLPIFLNKKWHLLSELGVARFLIGAQYRIEKSHRLGMSIQDAVAYSNQKLELTALKKSQLVCSKMCIKKLLLDAEKIAGPTLWLVVDDERKDHLAGVLSPFELM